MSLHSDESTLFLQAVQQFNAHQFFDYHETLETLWNLKTDSLERQYLQGLLQVGVGFYHWFDKHNYVGASHKLQEGLDKLSPLHQSGWLQQKASTSLPHVNLAHFTRGAQSALNQLLQWGPAEFQHASRKLIPSLQLL